MVTKKAAAPKAAATPKAAPDKWPDDVQILPRRPGDREHDLNRDCWCEPRRVGLPYVAEGSTDPVKRTNVLHRDPA